MAISGTTSDPGAKPAHWRVRPPSSAKAKPPTATSPAPGGPSGGSHSACAASARQRSAARSKRPAPRSSMTSTAPSAASETPLRSNRNHGSPSRREAATTAAGSTVAGSRTVTRREPSPRRPAAQQRRVERAVEDGGGHPCWAQVSARPRAMAISPVWAISIRPNGRTSFSKRLTWSAGPTISTMIERLVTSMMRAAEDLDELHDLGARGAVGGDLEDRELAGDRLVRLEVADLEHVDQLVQLLGHLVDRVRGAVDRQGDARQLRVVGRPDHERVYVEAAPGEQPRHAGQDARLVLHQHAQDVLAAGAEAARRLEVLEGQRLGLGSWITHQRHPTMSRAAAPGAIIGYVFSSLVTRTSTNAGPSAVRIARRSSTSVVLEVSRCPGIP